MKHIVVASSHFDQTEMHPAGYHGNDSLSHRCPLMFHLSIKATVSGTLRPLFVLELFCLLRNDGVSAPVCMIYRQAVVRGDTAALPQTKYYQHKK